MNGWINEWRRARYLLVTKALTILKVYEWALWDQTCHLMVMDVPYNTESVRADGEETLYFFATWILERGNRALIADSK